MDVSKKEVSKEGPFYRGSINGFNKSRMMQEGKWKTNSGFPIGASFKIVKENYLEEDFISTNE